MKMKRSMVHSEDLADPYPVFLKGPVAKGFGRGSKDLGIRTANLPQGVADQAEEHLKTGIYFGFASVGRSNEVNAMVMSFGWNPFYNNTKRSAEVHILHDFNADFYDEEIRVAVCGFIRDEQNYSSLGTINFLYFGL